MRFESRARVADQGAAHVRIDEIVFGDAQPCGDVVVRNARLVEALGFVRRQQAKEILNQLRFVEFWSIREGHVSS